MPERKLFVSPRVIQFLTTFPDSGLKLIEIKISKPLNEHF
jgi:hypothetical protein